MPADTHSPDAFGVSVARSVEGRAGDCLLATREFRPGDRLLSELPLARLEAAAFERRDLDLLRRAFIAFEQEDGGKVLEGLHHSELGKALWRGPGEDCNRVQAFRAWAADTWPEASEEEKAVRAETLTVFAYNAFASVPRHRYQLVYPVTSKANHSCAANVTVVAPEEGPNEVVCVSPLQPGDEVFTSYLADKDLVLPTEQRQEMLQEGWDFLCSCKRCTALVDDTRRFACSTLQGVRDDSAEVCTGMCLAPRAGLTPVEALQPCNLCGKVPPSSAADEWLAREAEGCSLVKGLPEGLYSAWALLEEFVAAHPFHWLASRWKSFLAKHTEVEAEQEEDADAAQSLLTEASSHWAAHWKCLEAMLPERGEGLVIDRGWVAQKA